MINSIGYNQFLDYSPDDNIWKPITDSDRNEFLTLVSEVESKIDTGTKKEKGDSLEKLMTFVYKRFSFIEVVENQRTPDNEIDHIIKFIDGMTPAFINENIGLTMIGESKNHKKSISVREVADLNELLRSRRAKFGIFSSVKPFSKGVNNYWVNAEGKRRKLALSSEKVIIGFTFKEIKSLTHNNFYTLLKQKYNCIIDEIYDDYTDEETSLPYQDRLHNSIFKLQDLNIISEEDYFKYKAIIEKKFGTLQDI